MRSVSDYLEASKKRELDAAYMRAVLWHKMLPGNNFFHPCDIVVRVQYFIQSGITLFVVQKLDHRFHGYAFFFRSERREKSMYYPLKTLGCNVQNGDY